MTSPSSSISNFDYRSYFVAIMALSFCLIILLAWLSVWGIDNGVADVRWAVLANYQKNKIVNTKAIDIAFVGDSSLGNSVDAHLFAKLADSPVVNLALTGSFGYGGTLGVMEKLLKREKPPHTVVIVQTLDMMTREFSYLGYLEIGELSRVWQFPLKELLRFYLNHSTIYYILKGLFEDWTGIASNQKAKLFAADFIKQATPLTGAEIAAMDRSTLLVDKINPKKLLYLKEIGNLCAKNKLNCIYAHGPILAAFCDHSKAYIHAVGDIITRQGLTMVPDLVCLPKTDVGDTEDHVNPAMKSRYTEKFFNILRPYIGGGKN